MSDGTKSDEDQKLAKTEYEAAVIRKRDIEETLTTLNTQKTIIEENLEGQKTRLEEAGEFLKTKENIKAAAELVKQQDAYAKLKTSNDTLKTRVAALAAKEFDGTASDEELKELDTKREDFEDSNVKYLAAKTAVEDRQRESDEKVYNKNKSDNDKASAELATAQANAKVELTKFNAAEAAITKQNAQIA